MAQESVGTVVSNASATVAIPVWATVVPETVAQVAEAVRRGGGRLSVSGSRISAQSQFALEGALHIDLSRLDKVIRFEPLEGTIRIQAGARWSDLLRFIQPHGFAALAIPPFADFSIGGSIAMNMSGLGVGVGPVAAAVRELRVVLPDGRIVTTNRHERGELFASVIGGMGGIAIIVEAELQLTRNVRLLRKSTTMPVERYPDYFQARIASDPGAAMHQAEIALPSMRRLRTITWVETAERCTDDQPLHYAGFEEPLSRVFDRSRPHGWLGRLYHQWIIEPLRYGRKVVHWRNFEASHPLTSLDPRFYDRHQSQLSLQCFVIPIGAFADFLNALRDISARYPVPLALLTVMHHAPCAVSHLALARTDAFAIQLALRALEVDSLTADDAAWSRELIDAAIALGGSFHPGYAMHATPAQFRAAFAGMDSVLAVRAEVDPARRLGNGAWTAWMEPPELQSSTGPTAQSEFHALLADPQGRDLAYRVLVDCSPVGLGIRLFGLLQRVVRRNTRDELIYRNLRSTLAGWRARPLVALLTWPSGWPRPLYRRLTDRIEAAWSQGPRVGRPPAIDGIVEVGGSGRLAAMVRWRLRVGGRVHRLGLDGEPQGPAAGSGQIVWVPARAQAGAPGDGPDDGPDDGRSGRTDRSGWAEPALAPDSVDLVLLGQGLSALPAADGDRALAALARALRPGGMLVLLEHDVDSALAGLAASMAVTLAALAAGDAWEVCQAHPRAFRSADDWAEVLAKLGLDECQPRQRLQRSPFGDMLQCFRRR